MAVFNRKSEEQEWSRFRGALAKDREETGGQPGAPVGSEPEGHAPPPVAAPPATPAPAAPPSSPSFRPGTGDVNVTIPSRAPRLGSGFEGEVESLIGERTTFEGTFRATGALRVLGTVQGEIESKGAIFVDERAQVTAKVSAAQVIVAGRVDGQIFCEGKVEIRPTGRVTGEIQAGALIIQEGAFFDGSSKMASGNVGHP